MTKDELMKYFSHRRYDAEREYIYKIMLEHPDVDDPERVEFAAGLMDECAADGVELSTGDALRLTQNDSPAAYDKILKELGYAGITDGEIIETLSSVDLYEEDYDGYIPSEAAQMKFNLLNRYADDLASGNEGIVVIGRPEFFQYANYGRLALAVLCEDFNKTEQHILKIMNEISDGAKVTKQPSYILVEFFIENIWLEP